MSDSSNSDFDPNDPEVVLDPTSESNSHVVPQTGIEPEGLDYWYFSVPGSTVQPVGNPNTSVVIVERFIRYFNLVVYRKDLIDNSRVYRIESRDLTKYPKDGLGYFAVGQPDLVTGIPHFRITNTDPGVGIAVLRDWTSVQ